MENYIVDMYGTVITNNFNIALAQNLHKRSLLLGLGYMNTANIENYENVAESMVGLVKKALRKSVNRRLLFYVQLLTVLKEVEAVVNARPLVYVGGDIDSSITLSPKRFPTLNPDTGIPELEAKTNDLDIFHMKIPLNSYGRKVRGL